MKPSTENNHEGRESAENFTNSNAVTWALTSFLLSIVSAIFAFGGTAGEPGGLYGRVATMAFLVIAVTMIFFIRRDRQTPR
ncbi:MAG: hypothetical protein ABW223_02070 [Rariglobus sp.]